MATNPETQSITIPKSQSFPICLTFRTAFLVTIDAFTIICHVTEMKELLIASPQKETCGYLYQIEWIFPLNGHINYPK